MQTVSKSTYTFFILTISMNFLKTLHMHGFQVFFSPLNKYLLILLLTNVSKNVFMSILFERPVGGWVRTLISILLVHSPTACNIWDRRKTNLCRARTSIWVSYLSGRYSTASAITCWFPEYVIVGGQDWDQSQDLKPSIPIKYAN